MTRVRRRAGGGAARVPRGRMSGASGSFQVKRRVGRGARVSIFLEFPHENRRDMTGQLRVSPGGVCGRAACSPPRRGRRGTAPGEVSTFLARVLLPRADGVPCSAALPALAAAGPPVVSLALDPRCGADWSRGVLASGRCAMAASGARRARGGGIARYCGDCTSVVRGGGAARILQAWCGTGLARPYEETHPGSCGGLPLSDGRMTR